MRFSFQDATEKFTVITRSQNKNFAFYARFFIHTLTEDELGLFFIRVTDAMRKNDKLFLEYRNEEDTKKIQVTSANFRSFHTAEKISCIASDDNLKIIYEVSGKGLAKWKNDDAPATRQIFSYVGDNS